MRLDEDAAPTTLVLGVEIDVALVYHLCTYSSQALVAMKPERGLWQAHCAIALWCIEV